MPSTIDTTHNESIERLPVLLTELQELHQISQDSENEINSTTILLNSIYDLNKRTAKNVRKIYKEALETLNDYEIQGKYWQKISLSENESEMLQKFFEEIQGIQTIIIRILQRAEILINNPLSLLKDHV